jgi:hypothetical protein
MSASTSDRSPDLPAGTSGSYTHDVHRSRSFSLALHRKIAERLQERPELVERARRRVDSEVYAGTHHEYAARWRALLEGPIDEVLRVLTADTDDAQAMRQTSPLKSNLFAIKNFDAGKVAQALMRDPKLTQALSAP